MELALKLSFIIKQITPSLWLHLKKKRFLLLELISCLIQCRCFWDLIYSAVKKKKKKKKDIWWPTRKNRVGKKAPLPDTPNSNRSEVTQFSLTTAGILRILNCILEKYLWGWCHLEMPTRWKNCFPFSTLPQYKKKRWLPVVLALMPEHHSNLALP